MKIFKHSSHAWLSMTIASLFFLCGAASVEATIEEQWGLWPYFEESIKWHSDWIRYNASTCEVNQRFRAYREFVGDAANFTTIQRNTYIYDDGTVVSACPACGPWLLDKKDPSTSSPFGIIHPARRYLGTITAPDRSAAWLMVELPSTQPSPAGFELFLGDGGNLRLSVGIVYTPTGELQQVSAIREDSRDFGLFWSDSQELAKFTVDDGPVRDTALEGFWPAYNKRPFTSFKVAVPGPVQKTIVGSGSDIGVNTLKLDPNNLLAEDVVYEMPDGIVVVCPSRLPAAGSSGELVIAAGWKKADGSWTASIEARYANFQMSEFVYTTVNPSAVVKSSKKVGKKGKKTKADKKTTKS